MIRGALPPLYDRWLEEVLGEALPIEQRAACHACVMCPGDGEEHPLTREVAFVPDAKCCTYLPHLPNYLVGAILSDPELAESGAPRELAARIAQRRGSTPLGVGPTPEERARLSEVTENDGFGRRTDVVCPYFEPEAGLCGLWRHRDAVCSTWFCKFDRGLASVRLWRSVKDLLAAVEWELSVALLGELDVDASRSISLYDDVGCLRERASSAADEEHRWGRWFGRERALYEACARLAAELDWQSVRLRGGQRIAALEASVLPRFEDFQRASTLVSLGRRGAPARVMRLEREPLARIPLCMARVEVTELSPEELSVRTADAPCDPVRITKELHGTLAALGGRSVLASLPEWSPAVLAELEELGLEALVSRGLLFQPPAAWNLGDTSPLEPDDMLCFFRDHAGQPVKLARTRADASAPASMKVQSGICEVTFDEPELFGFVGELVARQAGFRAGDAVGWGADLSWSRVAALLDTLVAERILVRLRRA
ncbi:MAG: hypothetical protein U0271_43000 [Polyangiaceae bacterium]